MHENPNLNTVHLLYHYCSIY